MRNRMLARFSNPFLFLVICFLTLFSPFAIRAQNNTNSCDWKYVMEYEWQRETRYNSVTDRIESQPVLRLVEKRKYICGIAPVPITVPNSVPITVPNSVGSSTSSKYSAPSDSPMIGNWKYEDACENIGSDQYFIYVCDRMSSFNYSQNGTVQSIHGINLRSGQSTVQVIYGNWKYTAKNEKAGVLEEFKDDKLVERGDVEFLGKSQLQYTVTFSVNPDYIGKKYIWNKQ